MIDREKVIDGLEYMITAYAFPAEEAQWLGDAIELLKGQETVKPEWRNGKAFCGKCGQPFPRHRGNLRRYCSYCGQGVKWE